VLVKDSADPISGYNTDLALRVLDRIVPTTSQDKVRLMTIFFGANDSCFATARNNQCVPLPEFRSNLIKIISTFSDRKQPRIILITNPPVDERTQGALDRSKGYELRRTAEHTKLYADAVRNVGNDLGVAVVDLWTAIMLKAGWQANSPAPLPGCADVPANPVLDEYLSDGMISFRPLHPFPFIRLIKQLGLHLSATGYKLLSALLRNCIATHWPDQLPENLPFVLPRWDDGDAWKMCGETDSVVEHRPRVITPPVEADAE
jgi:lysophospholipase L1-like esterase